MPDATLRIKNLSIALEAVSRIVGCTTAHHHIEELLQTEIRAFRKEQKEEAEWPLPARPAEPAPDDDIPF